MRLRCDKPPLVFGSGWSGDAEGGPNGFVNLGGAPAANLKRMLTALIADNYFT
jgi:hypothetical protein